MATFIRKDPPHPSQMLKSALLEGYGLTIEKAAELLGLTPKTLEAYVSGKRKISLDLAYRLDLAELGPAKFWLALQPYYDLSHYVHSLRKKPDVKTQVFAELRQEIEKQFAIENEKTDKLLIRKLLKMEQEERELAERKKAERAERKRTKEIADEKRTAQRSHSRATVHHQPAI